MSWRYQPVFVEDAKENVGVFILIEVHFDEHERLKSWTGEDGITPVGEAPQELTSDLCRMLVDAYAWQPVKFRDLKVGMKFNRALTRRQREELAKMAEALAHNCRTAAGDSSI